MAAAPAFPTLRDRTPGDDSSDSEGEEEEDDDDIETGGTTTTVTPPERRVLQGAKSRHYMERNLFYRRIKDKKEGGPQMEAIMAKVMLDKEGQPRSKGAPKQRRASYELVFEWLWKAIRFVFPMRRNKTRAMLDRHLRTSCGHTHINTCLLVIEVVISRE